MEPMLQDGRMLELRLFADYHQIHVFDEGSQTDLGDAWTDQAVSDRMAVGADSVAVGTTVNVNVQVTVEVLDVPPDDDGASFDHVAECSLHCSSGKVVVMGCTDYEPEAQRFAVPAGSLRLRASQSNLNRAYQADIDSDEDAETTERMRLQVWPAPASQLVVIKRWQAPPG